MDDNTTPLTLSDGTEFETSMPFESVFDTLEALRKEYNERIEFDTDNNVD